MYEQKPVNAVNNDNPAEDLHDLPMGTPAQPNINPTSFANTSLVWSNLTIRNYFIATVVVLLMGGGLWLILEKQGRVSTDLFSIFANKTPVATINGVAVDRNAYEKNRQQIKANAQAQGVDVETDEIASEIDNQALDTLINTELLRQTAERLEITVTSEEIQARYDQLVEQMGGEETLKTRLAELNIDSDGLQNDIESELIIQKLFAQAIDLSAVVVTDEEITEVFVQVDQSQQAEKITLDEVREVIETNIRSSKEQALINEYLTSLRAEADIEINL